MRPKLKARKNNKNTEYRLRNTKFGVFCDTRNQIFDREKKLIEWRNNIIALII
jgi:hypothetical protein